MRSSIDQLTKTDTHRASLGMKERIRVIVLPSGLPDSIYLRLLKSLIHDNPGNSSTTTTPNQACPLNYPVTNYRSGELLVGRDGIIGYCGPP